MITQFLGKELFDLECEEFCQYLEKYGNKEKAIFDKKIIKTSMKIYGFSSKEIIDFYNYFKENPDNFLAYNSKKCYEITLIQGFIIAQDRSVRIEDRMLELLKWARNIDNWAHCDMVCVRLKYSLKDVGKVYEFAKNIARDKREFVARCGVILLYKLIGKIELKRIFSVLDELEYGRYYVDMAVAWLCATALINYKSETLTFLKNSAKISDFVFYKSFQKARESRRILQGDKLLYKHIRRQ